MLTGLPSGFTRLNALTQGLQKTDLIVVAARPGMGKTAFALNIAATLTIREKYVVGFFSLEMSAQQLGFRIQCSEARVNLQRLREGRLSKEEKKALFFSTQQMREANLFVDDTPAITLLEMRARALQLKQRHGLDALFVDYLQIMGTRGKVENRTQEVSAFSRGLKALAKELDVPVIALSQLSRRTGAARGREGAGALRPARVGRHRAGRRRRPLPLAPRVLRQGHGAEERLRRHHRQAAKRPDGPLHARVVGRVHALLRPRDDRAKARACDARRCGRRAPSSTSTRWRRTIRALGRASRRAARSSRS